MATVLVHCPRCGSIDAESVEPVGIEFDRMRCQTCGHSEICDEEQIKDRWNESVDDAVVRPGLTHRLPSARFFELWWALGASGPPLPALARLRALYGESHRTYHAESHIGACLAHLDAPEVKALATHPLEVEAAVWYHDAIYDPRAGDNEEASARLVEETLRAAGVASERIGRIVALVLATKDHAAETPDAQLLVDVDLSILGETPEVFARFEAAIRSEYAWVPAEAYATGRAGVLGRFLDRPQIYRTAPFRDRYEARARANLAGAISALRR